MLNKQLIALMAIAMSLSGLGGYFLANNEDFFAQVKNETRGVYFPLTGSQPLYKNSTILQAVAKMKSINLNTAYVDTFARNHTLYPSDVNFKYTGKKNLPNPLLNGRDALQEFLDATKDKTIKTIAWFEYGFLGFGNSELLVKNPTWISLNSEGKEQSKEGTIWLNPFKPEVRNYITEILMEMVAKYPTLDGIQFDDHMAFNSDLGYDPFTLNLYKSETGKVAPRKPTTTDPFADPIWKHWLDWRTNKVTAFVKEITTKIKKANPKLLLSAAVNYENYAYRQFCQKWTDWLNLGTFSEMTVQIYRNDNKNFEKMLMLKENFDTNKRLPLSVGVGMVVFNEAAPFVRIKGQIEMIRKNGFRGINFWYYEFLDYGPGEKGSDRLANLKAVFPTAVPR
jgi:uncharacterized lipoprotein YddW (UPF0748 family)